MPKEKSIRDQKGGIPLIIPKIIPHGIIKIHAIIPNSTTQRFLTGSRSGPIKAIAITTCAKANQSVPYSIKGKVVAVFVIPS